MDPKKVSVSVRDQEIHISDHDLKLCTPFKVYLVIKTRLFRKKTYL